MSSVDVDAASRLGLIEIPNVTGNLELVELLSAHDFRLVAGTINPAVSTDK